jgi:hypothetical protein
LLLLLVDEVIKYFMRRRRGLPPAKAVVEVTGPVAA